MTTVIPFLPSNLTRPTFTANLDGDDYKVEISWNVSAQRYYIDIYSMNGDWIVTVPMITTPPARLLESTIYDPFIKRVVITMVSPTKWPVPLSPAGVNTRPGTMIDYTFQGFMPDVYNGKFRCLHINNLSFSYELETNPGQVIVLGSVSRMLNMISGVFKTSTLTYRNGMFEINP